MKNSWNGEQIDMVMDCGTGEMVEIKCISLS